MAFIINQAMNRQLRTFLWEGQMAAFIDELGVGWNDGACYVLASGLFAWATQEQEPRPSSEVCYVLVKGETRSGWSGGQHVVLAVRVGTESTARWLYLDGDGVSEEEELLRRWETEEGILHPSIAPFEETWLTTSQTLQRVDISEAIAKLLNQQFGPFLPHQLITTSTWEWGGEIIVRIRQHPLGLYTVATTLERLHYLYTCLWLMQQKRPEALAEYQASRSTRYAVQAPIRITHVGSTAQDMELHVQVHSHFLAEAVQEAFSSPDLPVEVSLCSPSPFSAKEIKRRVRP